MPMALETILRLTYSLEHPVKTIHLTGWHLHLEQRKIKAKVQTGAYLKFCMRSELSKLNEKPLSPENSPYERDRTCTIHSSFTALKSS